MPPHTSTAAILGAAVLTCFTTLASAAPYTGLVAYSSYYAGSSSQLKVLNTPTGIVSPVATSGLSLAENPDWSLDGQWLTFRAGAGRPVYVVHPDGTGLRAVSSLTGDFYDPAFSPDGSKIAFQQTNGALYISNFGTGVAANQTIQTNSSSQTILLGHAEWSPDGSMIALTNWGITFQSDIFLYSLATHAVTQITHASSNEAFISYCWTPDGTQLVVSRRDKSNNRDSLYRLDADGTDLVGLTTDWVTSSEGWPTYTPDGQHILFGSDRAGNADIWIMDPDGTNRQNLTNTTTIFEDYPSAFAALPVPEPASLVTLALGASALLLRRKTARR